MEQLKLKKREALIGEVSLPGSKSISNRYLLLGALAKGETIFKNLLNSDDTERMIEALIQLGIKVNQEEKGQVKVTGNEGSFPYKEGEFFLGNAGTAFRSLTAALALNKGHYILKGIPRMHERPIKDLVDALNSIGGKINYQENEGYPPLEILPSFMTGSLAHNKIRIKGDVSSQYLTALLMALPMLKNEVIVEIEGELISKPYIDITLKTLEQFGIQIKNNHYKSFIIPKNTYYNSPGTLWVEGDASSASYYLAAGAIAGKITVKGVGLASVQGDVAFAKVLEKMGAEVEWQDQSITISPPIEGKLQGITFDGNDIPDAAMTLAIVALFAEGITTILNIASWRVKETDRIEAMATELRKLGVEVITGPDSIEINPPEKLKENITIETYDDHRIAMCFSLCALKTDIIILDPSCVNKTFPTYFEVFEGLSHF